MTTHYHFIGIGGVGMSGVARILLDQKMTVSGSDLSVSATTERLKAEGATVFVGHAASHITPGMTVVYTTDIKKENPEFQAAKALQCKMLHRSELLQILMQPLCSLTVAGTHGKTTTSSLLAWVLEASGLSPSYAIGGLVPQLHFQGRQGAGNYFVAEACESDGSFLNYVPHGAIITNIDTDHLDFYGTEERVIEAFRAFIQKVTSPNHLFWCGEDPHLRKLAPAGISYGFDERCQLRASRVEALGWMMRYDVDFEGKHYPRVEVPLIGRHNVLNSLAVFGMALSLGIEEHLVREGLRSFGGVLRRAEKKGEYANILFLDDYAHHPTEIKATLKAIREAIGERRLVVAYQPHRYSRTQHLIGSYGDAFHEADELFVTEIYGANEAPIPGITHEVVMEEIQKNAKAPCRHVKRSDLSEALALILRPHDVCVTLGAGDITKACPQVLAELKLKGLKKLKVGVVMGGRSVEHEVSLRSAEHVLESLNRELYEVEQFGITRQGNWISGDGCGNRLLAQDAPQTPEKLPQDVLQALMQCEVVFPVLHGSYGEDGTIQGLFEMLGIPYVGCDYRSSAISMDKILTKKILRDAGIATADFVSFSRFEWQRDQQAWMDKIISQLHFPVFVKPSHLGSSVGVHQVREKGGIKAAIDDAFRFDTHVLVENGIKGREIEFSVLGNDTIIAYPPGEILTEGAFYDYEAKYGKNGAKTAVQAVLTPQQVIEGMEFVKKAYATVGCKGMARVDTFLDRNGKFWLNEINTIPGFTQISLFPKMCAAHGLEPLELMDRLIVLGLHKKREQDRLEVKGVPA